jgi:Zn-finger nucleic acid-binding protein
MNKPLTPEALNCPNCGGGVMSDKTQCEFCKSRLKTVGCPKCLGLMFVGAKFCTHCGAKAAGVSVIADEASGDCPRCKRPLQSLLIDTVAVRECERCGGFRTASETFENICADSESQASVLNFIGSDAHPHAHPPVISYVPCPDCGDLMNRSNFARSSGVIIDMCKAHGVWFDADELPKIIEFINKGGLSRAREKEKMSIEDERRKLRDDQRRMATLERRTGSARYEKERDENSIVSNILGFLFD